MLRFLNKFRVKYNKSLFNLDIYANRLAMFFAKYLLDNKEVSNSDIYNL